MAPKPRKTELAGRVASGTVRPERLATRLKINMSPAGDFVVGPANWPPVGDLNRQAGRAASASASRRQASGAFFSLPAGALAAVIGKRASRLQRHPGCASKQDGWARVQMDAASWQSAASSRR